MTAPRPLPRRRDREWILTWLHGVAAGHDLDARKVDGTTVVRTTTAPRKLTGDDHRLIAETLRECARDFEDRDEAAG